MFAIDIIITFSNIDGSALTRPPIRPSVRPDVIQLYMIMPPPPPPPPLADYYTSQVKKKHSLLRFQLDCLTTCLSNRKPIDWKSPEITKSPICVPVFHIISLCSDLCCRSLSPLVTNPPLHASQSAQCVKTNLCRAAKQLMNCRYGVGCCAARGEHRFITIQ